MKPWITKPRVNGNTRLIAAALESSMVAVDVESTCRYHGQGLLPLQAAQLSIEFDFKWLLAKLSLHRMEHQVAVMRV